MPALVLSCGSVISVLQSAYFGVKLEIQNVSPLTDLPPFLNTSLAGITTEDTDQAVWGLHGSSTDPSPTAGVWDPAAIYTSGALVSYNSLVYRNRQSSNVGHQPDLMDGWWTCRSKPPVTAGIQWGPFTYGYALDVSGLDPTAAVWVSSLTHSLPWTVSPPGDVDKLSGVFIKLNYADGTQVVIWPAGASATTGAQGLVANPGPFATLQCWHTSGLTYPPVLTLNGWPALPTAFEPPAAAGTLYFAQLQATGGTAPYIYGISGLPTGLTFDPATGIITGTPRQLGWTSFTGMVTDSAGATATVQCGIDVGCGGGGGFSNSFF